MKKDLKHILFICIFVIIGCALVYFGAESQRSALEDPKYIMLLKQHNFPIPEPQDIKEAIMSCGYIFSGIATGIIFYNKLAKIRLTPAAPKIFIGFMTFPFHAVAGMIGVIPFMFYKIFKLFRHIFRMCI